MNLKNPQPSLFMHHHSLQKLKRSLYLRFITFRIVHHHTSENYHRRLRGTCEELKQREGDVKHGRLRLKHLLSFCSEKRNLSGLKVFLKEGRWDWRGVLDEVVKMQAPLLTEVPSSLKQLARLVVRGFYDIEYSLIVDMLVRWCTGLFWFAHFLVNYQVSLYEGRWPLWSVEVWQKSSQVTHPWCLAENIVFLSGQSWRPWRQTSSCKLNWKLKLGKMAKPTGSTAISSTIRQV